MRPFRFGVSVYSSPSRKEWDAKARRAEELGFDVLLVADHLYPRCPTFTALAFAAAATERIRVGTFVLNNDFRHPVVVAHEAASLDLLSEGRFELGMGAGHMEREYIEASMQFDPASTRVERLAESVEIIRGLLGDEPVEFSGKHYAIRGHRGYPAPVQRPVPMLIGGNGRRVLQLAGRKADIVGFTGFAPVDGGRGVSLSHFSRAGLADRIGIVREAAGERFAGLELNVLVQAVVPGATREEAAKRATEVDSTLTADEAGDSPFMLLGSEDQMAADLLDLREGLGVSYVVVFEPAMEAFAPVMARVRAAEQRDRL